MEIRKFLSERTINFYAEILEIFACWKLFVFMIVDDVWRLLENFIKSISLVKFNKLHFLDRLKECSSMKSET